MQLYQYMILQTSIGFHHVYYTNFVQKITVKILSQHCSLPISRQPSSHRHFWNRENSTFMSEFNYFINQYTLHLAAKLTTKVHFQARKYVPHAFFFQNKHVNMVEMMCCWNDCHICIEQKLNWQSNCAWLFSFFYWPCVMQKINWFKTSFTYTPDGILRTCWNISLAFLFWNDSVPSVENRK